MGKTTYEPWLTEDGLAKVAELAADGLTYDAIAGAMGIGKRTLSRWKDQFPQFAEALATQREAAIQKVEDALYKRAIGYEFTEVKTVTDKDGYVTTTVTEKAMPPDTIAQIFFLKNRKPSEWRDRHDVELSGQVGLVTIVDDLDEVDPLS